MPAFWRLSGQGDGEHIVAVVKLGQVVDVHGLVVEVVGEADADHALGVAVDQFLRYGGVDIAADGGQGRDVMARAGARANSFFLMESPFSVVFPLYSVSRIRQPAGRIESPENGLIPTKNKAPDTEYQAPCCGQIPSSLTALRWRRMRWRSSPWAQARCSSSF